MLCWACGAKGGALRRNGAMEMDVLGKRRGRPKRRWLDKVRDGIREKGLSEVEVYDRATRRCKLSDIDLT